MERPYEYKCIVDSGVLSLTDKKHIPIIIRNHDFNHVRKLELLSYQVRGLSEVTAGVHKDPYYVLEFSGDVNSRLYRTGDKEEAAEGSTVLPIGEVRGTGADTAFDLLDASSEGFLGVHLNASEGQCDLSNVTMRITTPDGSVPEFTRIILYFRVTSSTKQRITQEPMHQASKEVKLDTSHMSFDDSRAAVKKLYAGLL